MLEASPVDIPLGVDAVAAAIAACLDCLQSCASCVDSDLIEADIDEMRACIALCRDCGDVCDLVARMLSRPAQSDDVVVRRLLQACVRQCTLCAEECARHAEHHRHCAVCAKTCRACEAACRELLGDEPLEKLETVAGG